MRRNALGVFLIVYLLVLHPLADAAETAVASLTRVEGSVEVKIFKTKKSVMAREGLLLFQEDFISTGNGGKTTILFRDGSEIRLFGNSELSLQQAIEDTTKKRSFQYKFIMKLGSFWGKFIQGRQKTSIETPTTTIGVKGTALRVTDDGKTASIALTEGAATVENAVGSLDLMPGQRLKDFKREDDLKDKVEQIPFKLQMKTENYQLDLSQANEATIRVTIQMSNTVNGENVKKGGRIYLGSNYYNVEFPKNVALDNSGFARIPILIRKPHSSDREFDGKVVIWAVMDELHLDDVGEGNLQIQLSNPTNRRMQIDVNSGQVSPL